MKLIISSIDGSISALNKSTKDKIALILTTEVSDNFRMEIDADYVMCSDDHYKKHWGDLRHRKRVSCSVTIYRNDELNDSTLHRGYFGQGRLVDEDFDFNIHLNSCTFDCLNSQINSIKKINDFYITLSSQGAPHSLQSSPMGGFEKLEWVRSDVENGNALKIESLEMGFNLYQG